MALIDIQQCAIIKGMLPAGKAKLALGWCELHKAELLDAWKKVENHIMPGKIKPL